MIVTAVIIAAIVVLCVVGGIGASLYLLIIKKNMTEQKTKALDIFMYLGIGISLIVSVTNLLQILFRAIEEKFPDILTSRAYVDAYSSDARMSVATLIVFFPIYVGLSWYVSKDIETYTYKRDLLIRKLFAYTAIFITVLTLVGTLVSVIYTYLGGELSTRFGYKALSVFVVALSVFLYYFFSLKRDFVEKVAWPKIAGVVASLVVIFSLVWSISIIGSPQVMRAKRIDATRLSDLSSIQMQVYNKVQSADALPKTLDELSDAFQGYKAPTDPVTQQSYEYFVIDQPTFVTNFQTGKKTMVKPAVFELCATFTTVRENAQDGKTLPVGIGGTDAMFSVQNYYYDGDISPFWNHKAERTCFKRVITPDMYYGR